MDLSADVYVTVVSATVVLLILLVAIISMLFIYQNKQIHHRLEVKRLKDEFQRELLLTQLEIKEKTLKDISEEIHDNIGQVLSLANLTLSSYEPLCVPERDSKLQLVMNLIGRALSDLRTLSKTLDPEMNIQRGLVSLVEWELNLISKTGAYETSLQVSGSEEKIEANKQLFIFRIIQEAISNVIKHAQATRISVMISFHKESLEIRLIDNGIGIANFSPKTDHAVGSGLRNMHHRAKMINAGLNIANHIPSGTQVYLSMPWNDLTTLPK